MIKKYISLIMVALLPSLAFAEKVLGTLTLATPDTKAICIYDTEAKTATLGNGYTSCINHYEDGELVIPGSVTYQGESYKVVIGQFAFRLCNKLTRVTIGEGVEHIGDYAFVGCSSVTEIRLPATLQTIGAGAFCNLTSLTTMRCMGITAPTWQWNDVFSVLGTKESMREKSLVRNLFVPAGNLDSYKNSKFDGTSSGTLTRANEKVGWEEAFARIYELSNEPLAITSKAEFIAFRNAVNNGTTTTTSFKLMADIDLSGEEWTPIGSYEHPFDGIFDGGGHIIKNLNVNHSSNDYQGLFGYATNATIYNMHLLNPKVVGKDYVGSVVGYAYNSSHITDVLVTSNFPSGGDYTVNANSGSGGGIVGYAQNATIERCMFRGRVYCSGWTGGIVGNVYNNVTISDCSASNFLHSFGSGVIGGIVGGAGTVNVNRCFARSEYLWGSLSSGSLGKIVGKTNKDVESTITNCAYWKANVDRSVLGNSEGGGTLSASGNVMYNYESDMNQDKTKTVLGTDNWYYFTDNYIDYPVPATLKDMYINNCVDVVSGDFVYRPAGDASYEIVKYTGSATSVTIPNTFNEKPVTAILAEVFKDNQTMASVTIGSNITSIGDRAFYNCDALTSVSLPNAVTYVGEEAFMGCDELTSFTIGTGFANHKGNFLAYCPKLTTITVADGNTNNYISVDNVLIHNVAGVGSYVVICAPGKTGDYTIPAESLTHPCVWIMNNCFSSCDGLTSITFPQYKWFKLDAAIFDEASSLRYVDISAIDGFINNDKNPINVTVDRSEPDNPFYGMSDYTMIYLPTGINPLLTGNTANTGEFNVVIGSTADRLSLTENWNFNPRVTPLTVSHGVNFNRSLEANLVEKVTDTDEDIVIDGQTVKKQEGTFEYVATGYTCYLPYALTLSEENAKVYKPSTSSVKEGVTTITFEQVENNAMEAYKPYYIVVSGSSGVDLSTDENITIVSDTNGSWTVGDYELKGTTTTIPNSTLYDANKPAYILQSDGKWHKVPENKPKAYIGCFRAYFKATSASATRALNMTLEDSEATAVDTVIRTIDVDGTEHYYDMNGRLLSGKPQKGMYIHNGKKYINK